MLVVGLKPSPQHLERVDDVPVVTTNPLHIVLLIRQVMVHDLLHGAPKTLCHQRYLEKVRAATNVPRY
jgi:hypothetical protein